MTKLTTDEKIDELGGMIARDFTTAREDLLEVRDELRNEFKENMAGLCIELKGDISELRTELKQDIYLVQKDIKALFTAQGKRISYLERQNI